jgi:hypothetical protein
MQATWRIWRLSLSSFTKFKRQDHVEVSTSATAVLTGLLKGVLSRPTTARFRHFVQNTSTIRCRLCDTLFRLVHGVMGLLL